MKISFKKRSLEEKRDGKYIPAVLYGSGVENTSISVNSIDFDNIYEEAGESSLVSLESEDGKETHSVLIHEVQKDPLSGKIIHVDFYQPDLTKEVEVSVPLIFEGEAPAVKDLGGTLVKNMSEVEVKSLPGKLPHDIKVNVEGLATFDDSIAIKDLIVPEGVEVLGESDEIIALVAPAGDVEEELEKPIEEDVEKVEVVDEKEKEETEEEPEEK